MYMYKINFVIIILINIIVYISKYINLEPYKSI